MPVLSVTTTQVSSGSNPMFDVAASGKAKLRSFDGGWLKRLDLVSFA